MFVYYVWPFVGVLLLLWVAYDLFIGWTYLHRTVIRKKEPLMYWLTLALWTGLALSCFWGF